MIDFELLYQRLATNELAPWASHLRSRIDDVVERGHGDLFRWQGVLNQLPEAEPSVIDLSVACPIIGRAGDLSTADQQHLRNLLQQLHPWRKGPFNLFGIQIDSEWRSDLKWARVADHIAPLDNKLVLDVGGGNGYYALRMVGAGARFVLSIDPSWLFVVQFMAINRYLTDTNAFVAPLAMEHLPPNMGVFDTVFSMGVLYHRRSPVSHLAELFRALKPGGQLVLETLVNMPGEVGVLLPEQRYAKMRNVWFIPPTQTLERWLRVAGFEAICLVEESVTSSGEQRRTDWMRFESLADYLDPADPARTVEGLPAPRRAVLTAVKPG